MSPLTDEDLDAIEARANTATPGPWRAPKRGRLEPVVFFASDNPEDVIVGIAGNSPGRQIGLSPEDAAFIAHAREDVPRLVAEVRRLDNDNENLRIAATIGPRVAEVSAAVERAASIARFRDLIAGFLRAPEMYAESPAHGVSLLSGAMLATGGNGRTWYDACLAVGLARGNVAVAAETWDDVRRLATHLRETAETWAVRL